MSERLDREFRYVLRRCPDLTHIEFRLLGFISTYTNGCNLPYEDIAPMVRMSLSTLSRAIKSLEKKKLIEKTYRAYKKVCLKIVCAAQQSAYADMSPMTYHDHVTHDRITCHPRQDHLSPMTSNTVTHDISNIERDLERDLKRNLKSVLTSNENEMQNKLIPINPGDAMKLVRSLTSKSPIR